MSSAIWSVASKKKSILFDVLFVMDRANRIKEDEKLGHEYSLLKAETVKKYDIIYKIAINQSDLMAAAFYVSEYVEEGKHDTIIYTYLINKALEMVSFNEMVKFLEKTTKEEIAYYIASACLSVKDKDVTRDDVAEIVNKGDRSLIEVLYHAVLPEKIKMSVYMIVFNYDKFLAALISYMKKIHRYVNNLYTEYLEVYQHFKNDLIDFMNEKSNRPSLIQDIKEKMNDEKQRKHIIVLSLIRLEYGRIKQSRNIVYYKRGFFSLQRVIHSSDFTIF